MMRKQGLFLRLLAPSAAALALAAAPLAASADISVEGGALFGHGISRFGGGASLGLFKIPATPIGTELTFITGDGTGSAGLLDARLHAGGTTLGAGIGVGNIGATSTTTVIYDAILAQSIAPQIAIEGRILFGPLRPSTTFAGLRITF
jgi:hypothetical protein